MSPESKREQIFDPDAIYETSRGLAHPPGKPPAGFRWSGVRSSETNPKLCRWQLVSTDTEPPSIEELPPPGFERHELSTVAPPKLFSVTGAMIEENRKKGGRSTQAGHIGEALDD